jgi:hypothetical protein
MKVRKRSPEIPTILPSTSSNGICKKGDSKKLEFQNVQNSKKQPLHIPNGLKSESRITHFFQDKMKNLWQGCRKFSIEMSKICGIPAIDSL